MWPGMVCSVAGGGRLRVNSTSRAGKLHEVELEVQKDKRCISCYRNLYDSRTQMCVGNPKKKKSSFKVRSPTLSMPRRAVSGPGCSLSTKGGHKACPGPDLTHGPLTETTYQGQQGGQDREKAQLSPSSLCPYGDSGGPPRV